MIRKILQVNGKFSTIAAIPESLIIRHCYVQNCAVKGLKLE